MEPVLLLAQSASSKGSAYSILEWVPILVFLGILILFLCPALYRLIKQYNELHQRTLQHMDIVEAKDDEIIGLLKEIRDKAR